MKHLLGGRRRWLTISVVVLFLMAGGIAYATIPDSGGVFTACRLNGVGTIRLIDPSGPSSSLLSRCTQLETQIQWNQHGQQGQTGATGPAGPAGKSPTVAQLVAGDSHCPTGGAAITDANGSTAYVCNGQNGQDGKSFSGTFTSPSGQFSLNVSDNGVQVTGPGSLISLAGSGAVSVQSTGTVSINGGTLNTVADNQNVTVHNDRSEVIGHDATLAVLHDRTTVIDHDETVHVKHDRTQTVDNNETITVHGARTEIVDHDQTTTIHGDRAETVDGNANVSIGGNRSETVSGSENINVAGSRSQSVGSNDTLNVGTNHSETIGGSLSVHVAGQVDLRGSMVAINGGSNCQSVARQGDFVSPAGIIATGSATVCVGP